MECGGEDSGMVGGVCISGVKGRRFIRNFVEWWARVRNIVERRESMGRIYMEEGREEGSMRGKAARRSDENYEAVECME